MQETEATALGALQAVPVGPRRLQQLEGSEHVGFDEILRAVDRTVHVRLGRKVHDRPWTVLLEQLLHQTSIADVALHEYVTGIPVEAGQVLPVPRVGQLVQVHHRLVAFRKPVEHEVRADEARTARH
jgi:hypothetical protein